MKKKKPKIKRRREMYKSIRIIYGSGIEERMDTLLKEREVKKYIKVPNIHGVWGEKVKHMNTHVWPGTDSVIMVIVDMATAKNLSEDLKKLKEDLKADDINAPFIAIFSPIDEII